MTKGHRIGGGPKTRFWSTPPRKLRKSLILLDFLGYFEVTKGKIVTEKNMGFKSEKSLIFTGLFALIRRLAEVK